MIAFEYEVTFRLFCGRCDEQRTETTVVPVYSHIPWPSKPPGWQIVNGVLICPKHEVRIINGKA
jgi:hypothetical protein